MKEEFKVPGSKFKVDTGKAKIILDTEKTQSKGKGSNS
jgi:hypothetical protein